MQSDSNPSKHPSKDVGSEGQQKALTYADYLAVEELLALQKPKSQPVEHDEMLFIVIHQAYELWFKQILWEFDYLTAALREQRTFDAMATLKRVLTILKVLVHQIDILETMTPVSFSSFRTRLESASGFQSAQFRETEMVLGAKNPRALTPFEGSAAEPRLRQRLQQPSLWAEFLRYLQQRGFSLPQSALERPTDESTVPDSGVQDVLLKIYQSEPDLRDLCERLVDLDEGIQEWRYRHVKMVERTIGDQKGTGGSSGVDYLKRTLFQPVFPDLWQIRGRL